MRLILFPISLFIFCYACEQPARQVGQFSFNPQPSKVYYIKWKEETTSTWTYQGEQQSSDKEESTVSLQLTASRDSLYQMKLTFDHFIINRGPAFAINTQDSVVYGKGILGTAAAKWNLWLTLATGKSVYIWINRKGAVQAVTGVDQMMDSIVSVTGEDKRDIIPFLQRYIGEKIIADHINEIFSIAPDHIEKKGATWVRNVTLTDKAPVKLSSMYDLKELKGDSVLLSVNTVVSGRATENADPFMEGRQTGDMVANYTTGIPYSYHAKRETTTKTSSYTIFTTTIISVSIQ